jgi:hypothetical protein
VVNIKEHLKQDKDSDYFRYKKMSANYTPLFKHLNMDSTSPCIEGKLNKEKYQANKELFSYKFIKKTLSNGERNIWEIPVFVCEYDEDNGSDDDEPAEDQVKKDLIQNRKNLAKMKLNPVVSLLEKEKS